MHSVEEVQEVIENEQEEVEIVPGQPGKTTRVAQDFEPFTRAQLLIYLERFHGDRESD